MKKLLLTFISGAVLLAACNKDSAVPEPPKKNPVENPAGGDSTSNEVALQYKKATKPVALEYTSVYCGGCGSWGKPTFKEFVAQNKEDVTPIAVHIKYNDPFITDISTGIAANRYGQNYTPQIWVADSNAVAISGGGIISQRSKENAARILTTAKALGQPALAAKVDKKGNDWKVNFGVKFIDVPTDGEYALACYLLEDGLEHYQVQSATSPTIHDHVIRASNDGTFGKPFAMAELNADQELQLNHTFNVDEYNADNTYITLVLWKRVGARYEPVNGYVLK